MSRFFQELKMRKKLAFKLFPHSGEFDGRKDPKNV